MLFADSPPQDIVVRKTLPLLADLSSAAERGSVEAGENSEGHFMGKNGKGIDSDNVGELVDEEGKLREAAHGQETLENQSSPRMG